MVLELNTTTRSVPDIIVEKYEESVELQNDCRSFYLNRIKASEHFKQTLNVQSGVNTEVSKATSSMSCAMDKLRIEMASLVDQDLSLMKQLLTLNETIEELKNKRLYGVTKDSLTDSVDEIGQHTLKHCKSSSTSSLNNNEFVS